MTGKYKKLVTVMINETSNVQKIQELGYPTIFFIPRPARRDAKVAGEEGLPVEAVMPGGKLLGAAFGILLTTAGEPGPRSMRLSSVASLRTW